MKELWKEKSLPMKVLWIAGVTVSIMIVILAVLQLVGILENADNIYIPGLSVLIFIQAAENWNKNKHTAYISLFAGLFILAIVVIHFFKFLLT